MTRREAAILSLAEYRRVLKEGGEIPYGIDHYVIPGDKPRMVTKAEYNSWKWKQEKAADRGW